MCRVIVDIIPMMIGAAVVPVWITIVLLLLRSPEGLSKAIAFVSGQILVRLIQGIFFRSVSGSSTGPMVEEHVAVFVNTLFVMGGVLLWITAIKKWLEEDDPDAPPPRWMAMFDSVSPLKAFGMSVLLISVSAKQWIFTFGALGLIREAELPILHSSIAFLLFILGAQSLGLIPITMFAVAPKRSPQILENGIQWLQQNNRIIVAVVSVGFGTFFIWKGIQGFRGQP